MERDLEKMGLDQLLMTGHLVLLPVLRQLLTIFVQILVEGLRFAVSGLGIFMSQ